jgi:small-conductance mechanosensitive channel
VALKGDVIGTVKYEVTGFWAILLVLGFIALGFFFVGFAVAVTICALVVAAIWAAFTTVLDLLFPPKRYLRTNVKSHHQSDAEWVKATMAQMKRRSW